MLPFKHLSHVSVVVADVDRARAFYGGVLGLPEIPRPDFGFPGAWYGLGGDVQLHIIVNDRWPSPRPDPNAFEIRSPHFALAVEDADALAERLAATGHPFHDYTSTPTGMRQLFVHDHDGNLVEFIGPTRARREVRMERPAPARG